ncbi:MAG: hypothetical protein ACK4TA_01400 [Saprospiraceae bacterium]
MKHLPTICLIVLLPLALQADCRIALQPPNDIRKEFVRFDQAFLPVLFYVNEGNSFEAKRAVFHLGYHWQQLRHRYEMSMPQPDWRNTFQQVDKYLDAAFFAIDANDFERAYTQLEKVKHTFFLLRTNYHIDYYIDYLYDFQASAAVLDETVNDEMLDLLQWEDVMAMSVELNRKWNMVLAKHFDADLYELNEDQVWKLQATQQSVTEALNVLNAAMDCADRAIVADASADLQLALLEVLRVFGNFEASATYYANRQIE